MEKENFQSKRNKIITGAARATACVALSGLLVGSLGLRLASLECGANHSISSMCPMAKIETALFGVEAGMEHQARDIERYGYVTDSGRVYTTDVNYIPAGSYVVPDGYTLKTDEDGHVYGYQELEVLSKTYINEFGEEQNAYYLPEGGVIGQNLDGSMYGYKKVEATQLDKDTIYYTVVTETEDGLVTQDKAFIYDEDNNGLTVSEYPVLRKTK